MFDHAAGPNSGEHKKNEPTEVGHITPKIYLAKVCSRLGFVRGFPCRNQLGDLAVFGRAELQRLKLESDLNSELRTSFR